MYNSYSYSYVCNNFHSLLIAEIGGDCLTTFQSAALSSVFNVGAMIGQYIAFNKNTAHCSYNSQIYACNKFIYVRSYCIATYIQVAL